MPDRNGGKLCSRVTAELGGRIVAGDYVPDQVLPTEADLCGIFGVSRTTIREAMKRLHGKGLVAGSPRNGSRVLPTARWNQFDAELLSWRMQRGVTAEIVDQLYEVRDCFEPRACALAAARGDPAEKARIQTHFEKLADASLDTEQRVSADLEFHLAIFVGDRQPFPDLARLGDPHGAAAFVHSQPAPVVDVRGGGSAARRHMPRHPTRRRRSVRAAHALFIGCLATRGSRGPVRTDAGYDIRADARYGAERTREKAR